MLKPKLCGGWWIHNFGRFWTGEAPLISANVPKWWGRSFSFEELQFHASTRCFREVWGLFSPEKKTSKISLKIKSENGLYRPNGWVDQLAVFSDELSEPFPFRWDQFHCSTCPLSIFDYFVNLAPAANITHRMQMMLTVLKRVRIQLPS